MSEHHVILGDGIAGATAALTIRRHQPDARITVITNEDLPLYNRVKTKEVAKGTTTEEQAMMHTVETYEKSDIDLRLSETAQQIEDEKSLVHLDGGETLQYDKLLIATGGVPRRLAIPGGDAEGILRLWTMRDAHKMRDLAQAADDAVAIGAGLLGIDIAVAFAKNDADTKYVMRGNRWWREGLSKPGSEIVERALHDIGVECVFFETPKRFQVDEDNHVRGLETESGAKMKADAAGVAVGLNLNIQPTVGSGVKTGEGVLTDSYMCTSVSNVYAAGDIAQYFDVVQDRINIAGSWASAKKQGEVAALNMVGQPTEFQHVDLYSVNHFDFMIGSVGSVYGDADAEVVYSDTEYRRLIFKQGRLNGAVLIGSLAIQGQIRKLIESKVECYTMREQILEPKFKAEDIIGALQGEKAEEAPSPRTPSS
jgi:NAD(P)H-nitrite reductase large subunit